MRAFARASGGSLDIAKARRAMSVAGAALFCVSVLLVFTSQRASASTDFTSFSAPLTGAHDFAVNFATQRIDNSRVGPIGLLDDGTSFFITDFASGMLYKFPLTGGDSSGAKSAKVFLNDLTMVGGVYYATTDFTQKVVTFDPTTLAVSSTGASLPCWGQGLTGDPTTGSLIVDTVCGIFKVKDPLSPAPTVKPFTRSKDHFDGNAFSSDGLSLWAADTTTNQVVQFNRKGKVLTTISDPHGPDGIVFALPDTNLGGIDISNNVFVNNNDGTIVRIDTNNGNTMTVVASGGTRGDYGIAGPDGCFYATQSDRVEQVEPCFFESTGPTTTEPDTTTTPPLTTTSAAPTTTAPHRPTTTLAPKTSPSSTPSTPPTTVAAPATALAFTGPGTGIRWLAVIGFLLAVLGLGLLFFAQTPWSTRMLEWLLGRGSLRA